jgi:hypothetical protein
MISTRSFCQTPTHEYVVPKSMPIAFFVFDAAADADAMVVLYWIG